MNKKIGLVVIGIIVLVGVFYGGMLYGKSQTPASKGAQAFVTFGANGTTRGTRTGGGMGEFTTGQIISKDATSITVGLTAGGSKIIFLDKNTPISKQTSGTMTDLAVGTQVSVTGAANADGSINAQSVQIRQNTQRPAPTAPGTAQ